MIKIYKAPSGVLSKGNEERGRLAMAKPSTRAASKEALYTGTTPTRPQGAAAQGRPPMARNSAACVGATTAIATEGKG
ncbi:hypothetical protein GW17_00057501 [Ensete ventricosum]|nr:hypothetical protein GW17_00057501 [Ensete ventricosum]